MRSSWANPEWRQATVEARSDTIRISTLCILLALLAWCAPAVPAAAAPLVDQPLKERPLSPAVGLGRTEQEKRLTQTLERLLAKLRAATSAAEKQRLERAIVEFVRGEWRGTWLRVDLVLQDVDAEQHIICVVIAGTTLSVDKLLLAKDASIWLDDQPSRLADLAAGMAVALQVAADGDQACIVGVRASKGSAASEIDRLIQQLSSAKFREREAASKALAALGKLARPALTRATKARDAEVCNRAQRLLEALANKENTWYCSGSHDAAPDLNQRCSIIAADGKLYCINERGERSQATVVLDRQHLEMNALTWGLKGTIEIDQEGTRIKWANGSKWTQKRP